LSEESEEARRAAGDMQLSCAGCLCSALVVALGAALLVAAYSASSDWLGLFGGLLAGLGLVAAFVSSALNTYSFARYLVARLRR
jgi:hypothetical protein